MNTLPEEIVINHILPYTYRTKDREHLIDIRSFTSDLGVLENVYWFEFKNITLLNDLEIFISDLNRNIFASTIKKNSNRNGCDYFISKTRKINRKIRLIWGLLTPIERTRFINKYIIDWS